MPPQVQDLQSTINQYSSAFDPQRALIDNSITQNEQSGVAQAQGLDAKKTQAFGDITQSAQNKGMMFSGFTPDQEAKYTAATYLPALAQLQATIAGTRSSLMGKKAEMDTSARTSAMATHEQQTRDYNAYQQHQADMAAQAAEAEKQRQFQAAQTDKQIRAQAANSAASRAAANTQPSTSQFLVQAFHGYNPNDKAQNYYTEREVIPSLMANYGLTKSAAQNLAYSYRKNAYGS